MTIEEQFSINRYHQQLIQEHGANIFRSVGWRSKENQLKRFEVLCEIGDLNNMSVLDVGCGNGSLKGYFDEHHILVRQYIGVDINEQLLDQGVEDYAHLPGTLFLKGDFTTVMLPATDYIMGSGALSYYSSDPFFLEKAISKLYDSCFLGLGFNLMTHVDDDSGFLRAYSPNSVLDICNKICSNTVIKTGYLESDFSIFMYH